MTTVQRRKGEPFEAMLKRFKHLVMQAGVLAEFKRREGFQGPAERRRAKRAASDRRRALARRQYQAWLERQERRGF